MLPPVQRLTSPEQFRAVVRGGRRSGGPTLVLHLLVPDRGAAVALPRAGFVVSKAVGGAVVRNRVRRRLRHLVAERLHRLPQDALLVVRAQPAAAAASYEELGREVDRLLGRCLDRIGVPA